MTTEPTSLAPRVTAGPLALDTWRMIEAISQTIHKSRLFKCNSPEQAAAIMLKGHDLGLKLTQSFEFLYSINGQVALTPRGALALIYQSGLLAEGYPKIDGDAAQCRVQMKRKDGFGFEVRTTLDEFAHLKDSAAWKNYPGNMLRWRAIGWCAAVVFPDVTGGLRTVDDLDVPVTVGGDVIEGNWSEVHPTIPPPPTELPAPSLDDLVAAYGAEAVVTAGEGKIPGTDEELAAVAAKLAADGR